MRELVSVIVFIILTSCSYENKSDSDFIDRIIDLTIETSNGEFVQLPNLYDGLTDNIPDDKDEKLIIVERLKEKGFRITNWGHGNVPPLGPRIVNIELRKGNCICEASKMYYSTTVDTLYQIIEGINCTKTTK